VVDGVPFVAGNAVGGSIAGKAVRIGTNDIAGGEIFAGESAVLADEAGISGEAEFTATDTADGDALVAGQSVSDATDLAGS
jgi:hypothetical protein